MRATRASFSTTNFSHLRALLLARMMSQRFGSPVPYNAEESQRRKRTRYLSRSDEEIIDEMDKRGLSYRAGWPTLPPMPIDTISQGAFEAVPQAYARIQEANDILMTQGIYNGIQGFVFRVPRDASETDDLSPYLTLLCPIDMQEHSHKVVNAIIRIRSVFKQYNVTNKVQIEFIDRRVKGSLRNFPIRYDDSNIRERWERTVANIVLQLLKEHEWLCLEMIRRGLGDTPEECPPTIVVTTPTARDSKWSETIVPAIVAAIADIAPDFQVEILCGMSLLAGRRRYKPSYAVSSTAYQKTVLMGSSIGVSGDDRRCSTLGGSVTLEGGIKCGLTNWHCVRDHRLDKVLLKTTYGALEVGNKTLMSAPQRILSPSTYDHHGYLGYLQRSIAVFADQAAEGDEMSRALKNQADKEYMDAEHAIRSLGHVYAGSGRRTVTANKYATDAKTGKSKEKKKSMESEYLFPLDWALIRLDNTEQRDIMNRLPQGAPPRSSPLVGGMICGKWSTFNVDKEAVCAAKYGRTSGWTSGEINSCLVRINPKEDVEIAGIYEFNQQNPGVCFSVSKVGPDDGEFIEPGDSGSVLLHEASGTQLGLLFGTSSSKQAMFIPIDIVFQDIHRVTGKQVMDPTFVKPEIVGLAKYQLEG